MKKTIYIILFIIFGVLLQFLAAGSFSGPAAAEEESLKNIWLLKETIKKSFLCEINSFCAEPSSEAQEFSIVFSWGYSAEDCTAGYSGKGEWTALPGTLKPGDSITTNLQINVFQTTECQSNLDGKFDTSIGMSQGDADEIESSTINFFGYAEARGVLGMGKTLNKSENIAWTVPEGKNKEQLRLRIGSSATSDLGGYIIYVYEYRSIGTQDQKNKSVATENLEQDVCGIGLIKASLLNWPGLSVVYGRDSGARFSDFSGEVTVAPGSDPKDAQPAEMDMVLDTGSIIKTELDSIAIISFADMTVFCMKPFTTVVLDTPPEKESKLSLLAGKVWLNVKKMIKDGTMDVTMNQAVAGIKGTILVLGENGETSVLKVISGTVELSAKSDGRVESVSAGEMISADKNGLSQKANFDIEAEKQDWSEFTGVAKGSKGKSVINYILGAVFLIIAAIIVWVTKIRKKSDKNER